MEAKDLMIGDWVYWDGNPYRISEISEVIEGEPSVCFMCHNFMADLVEIKPMPITAELLEHNGFELREGCTSAWDWHKGETSVHISGSHTCPIGQTLTIYVPGCDACAAFSSHRAISDLKIRGVHELQHALRLCRINKDIVLC